MADAFVCDRCEHIYKGRPHQYIGWSPNRDGAIDRASDGQSQSIEVCETCWNLFMAYIDERVSLDPL